MIAVRKNDRITLAGQPSYALLFSPDLFRAVLDCLNHRQRITVFKCDVFNGNTHLRFWVRSLSSVDPNNRRWLFSIIIASARFKRHAPIHFCRKETRVERGINYVRPGNRCAGRGNNRFHDGNSYVADINNDVRPGHDRVRSGDNRFAFGNDRRRLFDNHLRGGDKYLRYGDTYLARHVRNWLIPGVQGPDGDKYLWHGDKYLRDGDKYLRDGDKYLRDGEKYLGTGDDRRRSADNRVRDEDECLRSGNDYRPLTDNHFLDGDDRIVEGLDRRCHGNDRFGIIDGR